MAAGENWHLFDTIDVVKFATGDTLHLPYGNRSDEAIYNYTCAAMDVMFAQDCALIVVACNTATTNAIAGAEETTRPPAHSTAPAAAFAAIFVRAGAAA